MHKWNSSYVFATAAFIIVGFTKAKKNVVFPENERVCHLNDPDYKECFTRIGNILYPQVTSGMAKYHTPNLKRLVVPQISVDSGALQLIINNMTFYHLDDLIFTDFELDKKNKVATLGLDIQNLTFQSHDYRLKGQFLIFKIDGGTFINVTQIDGKYLFKFDYIVKEKGGQEYAEITNSTGEYDIKRIYIQADGLFGDNKELNDQINQAFDQNWQLMSKEIGPYLIQAVSEVIASIINGILLEVPYEKLFPD